MRKHYGQSVMAFSSISRRSFVGQSQSSCARSTEPAFLGGGGHQSKSIAFVLAAATGATLCLKWTHTNQHLLQVKTSSSVTLTHDTYVTDMHTSSHLILTCDAGIQVEKQHPKQDNVQVYSPPTLKQEKICSKFITSQKTHTRNHHYDGQRLI